jgi:predicted DNA-binding transcriptional regulator AlpA
MCSEPLTAAPLLTVKDVARRLAMSEKAVYARCEGDNPILPHLRIGNILRFEPEAIEAFIARQRVKVGS